MSSEPSIWVDRKEAPMRRWLTLSIVSVLVLTYPLPAASGGGATFDFGSDYLVIGDDVTGRTGVWLGAKRSGHLGDGPFHAYLVPANTHFPEEGLPQEATWLAPISFEPEPGPYATATVSFRVPDVPPGDYSLMVCDVPCTTQSVGDLIGGWFTIASSPVEARIQSLADRIDWKTGALRRQMNREEKRAERTEEGLATRVDRLQRELDALASRTAPRPPDAGTPAWLAGTGWGAALMLALTLLTRRRRKEPPPPPGPEAEWVIPEERVPAKT
jgi:hypothetical protein